LNQKKRFSEPIPYSESQKIFSALDGGQSLVKGDEGEEGSFSFTKRSSKTDVSKTIFLFKLAPEELAKTANRLCSLTIYLQ
jgi:hypothetical protein